MVAENLFESEGAHKRRQDHGNQQRRVGQRFAGEIAAVIKKCQPQRKKKDHACGTDGNGKTVPEAFHIDPVAEKFSNEMPVASGAYDCADREKQKRSQKEQDCSQKKITEKKL